MKKTAAKKIGGVELKLAIAESNLAAKNLELDRVARLLSEVTSERDFLRKVTLSLAGSK